MSDLDNNLAARLGPIPEPGSPAGQLAQALRALAPAAGVESFRQLAVLANYSPPTISVALSGDPRQVPTREVVEAICTACDADEPTRALLQELRATAAKARPPAAPAPDDPASSGPVPPGGAAPDDPAPPGPPAVGAAPPAPAPDDPVLPGPLPPRGAASGALRPPGPAPRRKWLVGLVVALVVLVAAGVVGWLLWPRACGGASGIQLNDQADGECIGVTDGSYLFNDPNRAATPGDRNAIERINDIENRIAKENSAVAGTALYVKVVLLSPLTVSQARPPAISLKQISDILEGVYTGLYRANHSRDFGDPTAVQIQLLLANQGSRQAADPDFINGIVKASQPDHPVVTVIGLGSSVPNTAIAADELAHQGIPMVGAAASADSLTHLPSLWSVSPSNSDYAGRLKAFLDQQTALKSGIIVYDRNPDLFTQSLALAYHDHLKPYDRFPDQSFQGSTLDVPAAADVFSPVVTNLCNAANDPSGPLDMVFYAGRVPDLGAFTEALQARTCRQRPLTVLFPTSSGVSAAQQYKDRIVKGNVTVVVATTSDSVRWGRNESGTPAGYAAFLEAYHQRGFLDDGDLLDGYLIAHHDALVTAAQAVRRAAQGTQTRAPNAADVAGQFGNLNLASAVTAASGTLSFSSENGPEGGRATGLSIPIEYIG